MDPVVQAFLYLVVDLRTKPGQATEGGLDVSAGTAEPVVEIKVTEGGIEVVTPHQANDPAAEPDAFRVACGAIDNLSGFRELIGLALVVPGGIGRTGRRWFAGLVRRGGRTALGKGRSETDGEGQAGNGEVTQKRNPKLKHPLTHKFPELVPAHVFAATHAVQIGPQCGGDLIGNPMADILDFVQQSHNFIALW